MNNWKRNSFVYFLPDSTVLCVSVNESEAILPELYGLTIDFQILNNIWHRTGIRLLCFDNKRKHSNILRKDRCNDFFQITKVIRASVWNSKILPLHATNCLSLLPWSVFFYARKCKGWFFVGMTPFLYLPSFALDKILFIKIIISETSNERVLKMHTIKLYFTGCILLDLLCTNCTTWKWYEDTCIENTEE